MIHAPLRGYRATTGGFMSEQRTTWLRFSLTLIAIVYAVFGAAVAMQLAYAVLFVGFQKGGPAFLDSLIPLLIAFGLFTLRPWARVLSLVVSGFLLFVGIVGLLLCVAYLFGFVGADGGMIVDRPMLALGSLILLIAFAGWQWFVLSRPSIRAMFCTGPNRQ
jgi:hypothetical protein